MSGCTGTIESPTAGPWEDSPFATPGTPNENGQPTAAPGSKPTANAPQSSAPASGDDDDLLAPGSNSSPRAGSNPAADGCAQRNVGTTPLRRVSRAEYDNAVADLLGDTTHPARAFVADTQVGLFDSTAATQTVPTLLAEQYLDAAVSLAEGVSDVPALTGCDPDEAACIEHFIKQFGRRAFRRPVSDGEYARYIDIFESTRSDSDAATGIRAVIAAVLASPNFLFHPELGATTPSDIAGTKNLTAYELAGRLAQLLWASVPDDTLLDAAESGKLATRREVLAQAERMLDDERARPALAEFYRQWFGLSRIETVSKDNATYPDFDETLRASMSEESRRFIDDVLWNGDGKLSTLLSASYSFVNEPLAELYGVEAPAGAGFAKVELDPEERAGVLTQAAVLAGYARPDQSSPIKRGQWVRVRLLCQELPDPPAGVPELPAPAAGVSNRERFAMHTNSPSCSGCHSLIDGLGFGLEAYDGIGRFRTQDQGVAVDASGEITKTRDSDGKYDGAVELATRLAKSEQVRDCAPTQWLRYTLGRAPEAADSCSTTELQDAFAKSGGDLRQLMLALTQTDLFWHYRQPT